MGVYFVCSERITHDKLQEKGVSLMLVLKLSSSECIDVGFFFEPFLFTLYDNMAKTKRSLDVTFIG